jgi:hypothetical protein
MWYMGWMRIKTHLRRLSQPVRIKTGVWSASVALILGGSIVVVAPPSTAAIAFGWASIGFGLSLLLWGVRIHGQHLWQPWWRGKPSPFSVKVGVRKLDYVSGSIVSGIPWQQGFSHVYVDIRNESPCVVEHIDALFGPEHPIIHSSARCDFADCRIAPLRPEPQITMVYKLPNGETTAEPHDSSKPGNYVIGPHHRLHCDALPSGAEIHIDLATVVMEEKPTPTGFWKKDRRDPKSILVVINWNEDGCAYVVQQRLELTGVEHG